MFVWEKEIRQKRHCCFMTAIESVLLSSVMTLCMLKAA